MGAVHGEQDLLGGAGSWEPGGARVSTPQGWVGVAHTPHWDSRGPTQPGPDERGRVARRQRQVHLGRCSLQQEPHVCPIPLLLPETGARALTDTRSRRPRLGAGYPEPAVAKCSQPGRCDGAE